LKKLAKYINTKPNHIISNALIPTEKYIKITIPKNFTDESWAIPPASSVACLAAALCYKFYAIAP
jgi:hypothetical protein